MERHRIFLAKHAKYRMDFWLGADRTGGPAACGPWLRKTDSQGRARYWFEGRMRFFTCFLIVA
jgi:hypothetical protein